MRESEDGIMAFRIWKNVGRSIRECMFSMVFWMMLDSAMV